MSFTHALSTNRYGESDLIVSTNPANGTHVTLALAIAAAVSGQTIFLRDTVTENVTLPAGINIAAWVGGTLNTPTIIGTITCTDAGTRTISGIRLQTNSAAILAVTGSAATVVYLNNCYFNLTNNSGITFSSSSASSVILIDYCRGNLGTSGINLFTCTGAGVMGFNFSVFDNTGLSTTANTTNASMVNIFHSVFNNPITTSATGNYNILNTSIDNIGINTTCITTAGTGVVGMRGGFLRSGSASAVSIGAGTSAFLYELSVLSSNTNAITGSGTLVNSALSYESSSLVNTTTVTANAFGRTGTWSPGVAFGGLAVGVTYGAQIGHYTQIGNIVYINGVVTTTSKGSSVGNMTLTGLPITQGANVFGCIEVGATSGFTLTATYTNIDFYFAQSTTTFSVYQSSNTAGGGVLNVTNAMCANATQMSFSGFYLIA